MDRYEQIIRDIIEKTQTQAITWQVVTTSDLPETIRGRSQIRRCYKADYIVGQHPYNSYFVEIAIKSNIGYSSDVEERVFILYIMDFAGNAILFELNGSLVEREDLNRLAGLIEVYNDQARRFFDAFLASQKQ
jgi:hypothetical protein